MTKLALTPSELAAKANGLTFLEQHIHAEQAAIATGVIWRGTVLRKCHLRNIYMGCNVTGGSGDTDVQVKKNTVQVGSEGTIDNAEADRTSKSVNIAADFDEGDILEIEVMAAPGSGTGLWVDGQLLLDFDA